MFLWQIWLLIGIVILIVDLFSATIFLVNISLAFFLTALVSFFGGGLYLQLTVLAVFSAIFLLFLRPFLMKKLKQTNYSEFESKYIGQHAKVIEKVSQNKGRIAVFGEEWSAVSQTEQTFEVGEMVKIIAQSGLTMTVDRI